VSLVIRKTVEFFLVSVAVFGVLVTALETPSWATLLLILALLALLSLFMAIARHGFSLAVIAIRRAARYNQLMAEVSNLTGTMREAHEFLASLTANISLDSVGDNGQGTVRLALRQPAMNRLTIGATIEVVRRTNAQILGLAQVTSVNEDYAFAEPLDRMDPDFWEGLEDRMKRDYSAPVDVEGRLTLMTGTVAASLLAILRAS
jgi:hypothetical protein